MLREESTQEVAEDSATESKWNYLPQIEDGWHCAVSSSGGLVESASQTMIDNEVGVIHTSPPSSATSIVESSICTRSVTEIRWKVN